MQQQTRPDGLVVVMVVFFVWFSACVVVPCEFEDYLRLLKIASQGGPRNRQLQDNDDESSVSVVSLYCYYSYVVYVYSCADDCHHQSIQRVGTDNSSYEYCIVSNDNCFYDDYFGVWTMPRTYGE